jgi:hypothetical protein
MSHTYYRVTVSVDYGAEPIFTSRKWVDFNSMSFYFDTLVSVLRLKAVATPSLVIRAIMYSYNDEKPQCVKIVDTST